ncbi:HAD family hydrolase [candidate division WWE3 bacterium]|nr:HAD family hydrolase [candidate division WWE3 bacterium]
MKTLLFDIDHTLLNTTSMVQNLINMVVQETNLSLDDVENYHSQYVAKLPQVTRYDFIEFVSTLPVSVKAREKIKSRYLNDSDIYTKYPDVDKILGALHKKGYRIGVFSEGTPRFQENKLKNLQISSFLDTNLIFISQSKRSQEYIGSLPAAIIIDDNIDICNILAIHKKHRTIHLNIKDKRFTTEKDNEIHNSITSVNSLKELLHIL